MSQGLVASALPASQAAWTPCIRKTSQECSVAFLTDYRGRGVEPDDSNSTAVKRSNVLSVLLASLPVVGGEDKDCYCVFVPRLWNKNQTTSQKELLSCYHCHMHSCFSQPLVTQQRAVRSCQAESSFTVHGGMENTTRYISMCVEHDNKQQHTSVCTQTTLV